MKLFKWLQIKVMGIDIWPIIRLFRKRKVNRFGWVRQEPDERDHKMMLRFRDLPLSVDLRNIVFEIFDQGSLGSCTAQAIAAAYRYEHLKQKLGDFIPSRLFIYYNERKIEGTVHQDSGAIIRDGFKTINRDGACNETLWPYKVNRFACKPSKECYKEALNDQAIEYMSVEQSAQGLKGCLADGFPFVFGFVVYSNFQTIGADGIMPMPNSEFEGGHATLCMGYDDAKQVFIVRNSWGEKWGDKGYFYMAYDYMFNRKLCSDFWAIKVTE